VPGGPTCQRLPNPILSSSVARWPTPAALGPVSASRRPRSQVGALPNHCRVERPPPLLFSLLHQPKKAQAPSSAPFSPPAPHLSRLKRVQGCPISDDPLSKLRHWRNPLLAGLKAKVDAFSPLPGELCPLVHHVIDQAAPHPPLSVALP
jgi:hypothetical protein